MPVDKENTNLNVWTLAWGLGFDIAVPLVVFALFGRLLDKSFGTSPWLLLLGIVLAIISSTYIIYRKVSRIIKDTTEKE